MEELGGPQALPVTRDAAYRWTMLARAGTCDAGDSTPTTRRAWAPTATRRRGYETRYAATPFDTAATLPPSTDAALSGGCFAVPRTALRRWRRFDERPRGTASGPT